MARRRRQRPRSQPSWRRCASRAAPPGTASICVSDDRLEENAGRGAADAERVERAEQRAARRQRRVQREARREDENCRPEEDGEERRPPKMSAELRAHVGVSPVFMASIVPRTMKFSVSRQPQTATSTHVTRRATSAPAPRRDAKAHDALVAGPARPNKVRGPRLAEVERDEPEEDVEAEQAGGVGAMSSPASEECTASESAAHSRTHSVAASASATSVNERAGARRRSAFALAGRAAATAERSLCRTFTTSGPRPRGPETRRPRRRRRSPLKRSTHASTHPGGRLTRQLHGRRADVFGAIVLDRLVFFADRLQIQTTTPPPRRRARRRRRACKWSGSAVGESTWR